MTPVVLPDNSRAPGPAPSGARGQYLTFMLGGEVFAIGIRAIKEIIEYGAVTVVPLMPACIPGVINLRGAMVPVMDLSARFGGAPMAPTRRTCIVIVEMAAGGEERVIGMVVDAVSAVLEIAGSEIEPAPRFGAGIRADFIAGMGKVDGKFVIVLDIDGVLSIDEMGALTDVGAPARPAAGQIGDRA